MNTFNEANLKQYAAAAPGGPKSSFADRAPSTAEASLSYHSQALAELVKRTEERVEGLRALADYISGPEPQPQMEGGNKTLGGSCLGADMGERILAIARGCDQMAHEYGRLDRAIRG